MSALLDTKRAALHDISNKGASFPGADKVREPRAASARGQQLSSLRLHTALSAAPACQQVSRR